MLHHGSILKRWDTDFQGAHKLLVLDSEPLFVIIAIAFVLVRASAECLFKILYNVSLRVWIFILSFISVRNGGSCLEVCTGINRGYKGRYDGDSIVGSTAGSHDVKCSMAATLRTDESLNECLLQRKYQVAGCLFCNNLQI